MCPLELTATPASSPKFRSAGSLIAFGTESNGISGTACWARTGDAHSIINPKAKRFMLTPFVVAQAFRPARHGGAEAPHYNCRRSVRRSRRQAADQMRVVVLARQLECGLAFLGFHVGARTRLQQHVDHRRTAEVNRRRVEERRHA